MPTDLESLNSQVSQRVVAESDRRRAKEMGGGGGSLGLAAKKGTGSEGAENYIGEKGRKRGSSRRIPRKENAKGRKSQ